MKPPLSKLLTSISAVLISCISGYAQNILTLEEEHNSRGATINDVAWIAGHWQGAAFGGIAEEIWSPPMGDAMVASFRLVAEGKTSFYEIETISEENNTLILRLKHFHANLKGWEEKDETVDFPLVKLEPNKAFFDGMTFEKVSENELNVYVLLKGKDGEQEMKFAYRRVE